MHCDLCGTKVKVVGHTTKHYEPVVDREMIYKILEDNRLDVTDDYGEASEKLVDAIISAMYGDKE